MKIEEFRGMEDSLLTDELKNFKHNLLEIRCKVALGEEVHPHKIKEYRRDIARIQTVINERSRAAAQTAATGGEA